MILLQCLKPQVIRNFLRCLATKKLTIYAGQVTMDINNTSDSETPATSEEVSLQLFLEISENSDRTPKELSELLMK